MLVEACLDRWRTTLALRRLDDGLASDWTGATATIEADSTITRRLLHLSLESLTTLRW